MWNHTNGLSIGDRVVATGKKVSKSKIGEKVDIKVQILPYHGKFLAFLLAEAGRARSLSPHDGVKPKVRRPHRDKANSDKPRVLGQHRLKK